MIDMTNDKPKTGTENNDKPLEGNELLMHAKLIKIKDLRWATQAGIEAKKELYAEFEKKHEEFINGLTQQQKELDQIEDELKTLAVSQYAVTGNKRLYGGVSIRLFDELEYTEEDALKWAKETNMALKLDATAFKKIAKATPIDCVTITKEPRATIPAKIQLKEENVP
jgi:hypothetical protein